MPRQQPQAGEIREATEAAGNHGLSGVDKGVLDARQDEAGGCHLLVRETE